jgi:actin related protein 2/3 complex, subunit 4
MRDDFS